MAWDNEVGASLLGLVSSQEHLLSIVLEDEEPEAELDITHVAESQSNSPAVISVQGRRDSQPPSRQSARWKRKPCESPEVHTILETQQTQNKKRGRPKKQTELDVQKLSEE